MASDEIPTDPIGRLTRVAEELTAAIQGLNLNTANTMVGLAKNDARTRRIVRWLIVAAIVKVGIIVVLAFALIGFNTTQNRVDQLTTRLNVAQTVTRQQSLCPLYQLFLDAAASNGGAAKAPNPSQYAHAMTVIQNGYNALNCSEFTKKVPPTPSPSPTP